MLDTVGKPQLQRALIFLLIFGVSLPALPLAALAMGSVLHHVMRNFMFFWPQIALVPNGLMNMDIGGSKAFFANSAIYFAVIMWVFIAVLFGNIFKEATKRRAAWFVLPIAVGTTITFQILLNLFGYTVYLDGP